MRWVVIGVAALLVGLLAYGVAQQDAQTTATSALDIGERPPDVALKELGTDLERSLADYRGQVVLVNFWASWCPPCTDELPLLERTQQQLSRNKATVVGINTLDASEDALGFVDRYGLTFPSLRDGSGDVRDEWGVAQLPESFLLDRDGRVAAVMQGTVDERFISEEVLPLAKRS